MVAGGVGEFTAGNGDVGIGVVGVPNVSDAVIAHAADVVVAEGAVLDRDVRSRGLGVILDTDVIVKRLKEQGVGHIDSALGIEDVEGSFVGRVLVADVAKVRAGDGEATHAAGVDAIAADFAEVAVAGILIAHIDVVQRNGAADIVQIDGIAGDGGERTTRAVVGPQIAGAGGVAIAGDGEIATAGVVEHDTVGGAGGGDAVEGEAARADGGAAQIDGIAAVGADGVGGATDVDGAAGAGAEGIAADGGDVEAVEGEGAAAAAEDIDAFGGAGDGSGAKVKASGRGVNVDPLDRGVVDGGGGPHGKSTCNLIEDDRDIGEVGGQGAEGVAAAAGIRDGPVCQVEQPAIS